MAFSPRTGAVITFTVEGAQSAQRQIDTIGSAFDRLSTMAVAGVAAIAAGYAALNIGAYAKDAVLLAARYETLGIVMRTAGENAGYSNAQMDAYARGLEKSGISMMKAREAMISMTTANLDNNKSLELGRLAQNLAVVANKSSSDTLTDLITNIQQADTEGLKHMGIILNSDEALQKYALSHNTVVKALTQTQKAEAVQAAVMQQGAKYAGIYEQAMGTAGKALGSLDRYFENIKVRLGTPFLEGFAQGVFGVTDGVKQLNKQLEALETNGVMQNMAKSIGSSVGSVISVIQTIVEVTGQIGGALVSTGKVAADFFDKYLGGMATVKAVTISFALLLSGFMVEQAVIGFNALSAAAWGAVVKVGAAFLAMSRSVVTFFAVLNGAAAAFGWGTALAIGARTVVAAVGTAIASIPGAVGAVVVAAGLAVGYVFAKTIGDQINKLVPKFIDDAVTKAMAWVVSKTTNLPEISEAVERNTTEDKAKAAANKAEKDRKEQLMRDMNNSVVAAESQIAITSSANTRLKALNDLRDQQLKQSLDQRIITQADYLQKKEKMDVAEAQGQLDQIAAQKAQLAAYIAASQAGAPLGQGRDPAADANEMIKLSGEAAAAQTKLNAVKQSYAYQIAGALIEGYTKEYGSIETLVEAQRQLRQTTVENYSLAGKTTEQQEIFSALRLQSSAKELAAEVALKVARGTASGEYIKNTTAMVEAMEQMGAARIKAVPQNVAAGFLNDTKQMADETTVIYEEMRRTFISTDEERVRSAAAASLALARIRLADASVAIDKTNDSEAQKITAKNKLLDDYKTYANAVTENANAQALKASNGFRDLAETMSVTFDPTRVEQFGSALSDSFGNAGDAMAKLLNGLTAFDQAQRSSDAQRLAAAQAFAKEPEKLAAANAAINAKQTKDSLGYYANVAGAAKGFFKEGSKGYAALEAAEKTYRAFEMAVAIKNMVAKSGLLEAFTGLFVASKATETAATVASVAPDVAASMAKGAASAAAGVAGQAAGDPYTAWARMAAMAAAMAALGFVVFGGNGGGGGQTAAEVQKTQGTGSVFGDSSAKSDSIARSIALSAANSNIELNYTAGMLAALKSIDASMSGLTNLVVQTTGVTDGSNLGIQEGTLSKSGIGASIIGSQVGMVIGSIFGPIGSWVGSALGGLVSSLWGKTTQNIVDSGLQLGGTVSDLQSGKGFQQYASVDTTKSSWFGLSKSTSNSVQTAGLNSHLSSQFGLIFTNLENALKVAAGGLGIGADAVGSALDNLVISTTKVSLKDLKGDELTAAINGVISKTMDEMASAAIPGLDKFRKVGEGYAQTVVRIATDYANVDGILMGIGKTFGAVGIDSVGARENLIALAGGIDELASQTKSFASNFLSQAEQLAPVSKYVTEQLAAMGLASVQTRDDFKNVVLGLDLTNPAAQQTYTSLMALQEAFAKTHAATVDLTKTEQEIADERKDLQNQLDDLTMTSAQLLKKQRDALDSSTQSLFDQIQVATAAKKAQDDAKTSLGTFLSQMKSFATSVAGYNNNLVLGSLTTLTPEQQLAEARRQFEQTRDKAFAGDATAQGALQGIENTFLTLSQRLNGGDAQYSSDLAGVMKANDQLANWAAGQVDVAQASLDALNKQVDGIDQLNATMLSVAANMQYLPTLSGDVSTPVFAAVQAPTVDWSSYGTAVVAPLVAQMKIMQTELEGLRADAKKIAGDGMANDERIGNKVAELIVDGVHDAVTDGAYAANNATRAPS